MEMGKLIGSKRYLTDKVKRLKGTKRCFCCGTSVIDKELEVLGSVQQILTDLEGDVKFFYEDGSFDEEDERLTYYYGLVVVCWDCIGKALDREE